jgi:DNA-binding transcriptional ArsR family regulator
MKVEPNRMKVSAGAAEELLRALANRHRLSILCRLVDGERSVGDLAEFLELRDSTVSQHLALLRKDGLVSTRRDGQTIWYALVSGPARKLIETLYEIYCGPAASLASHPRKKQTRQIR